MTIEITLNNRLYRYSNTEYFIPTKNTAHCTIVAEYYHRKLKIWRLVINWDIIDSIMALRNKAHPNSSG